MEKDIKDYFKKFYDMKPYLFIDEKEWKHIMKTYEKDDVVEELSSAKGNPQNNVGTVSRKDVDFKSISKEERRDNWSSILNNFKR